MNNIELSEYVAAYEAWWSATEYYNHLIEKCLKGEEDSIDEL